MKFPTGLCTGIAATALSLGVPDAGGANWPSWRGGVDGSGISRETNIAQTWSTNENVRWKVELPGPGNSSPVVWGQKIFITQSTQEGKRREVICFNRKDGRKLWAAGVTYTAPEESHEANPQASSSPTTDGSHVFAWFGSAGVYCFDLDGMEIWHRDLGPQKHEWGYGASPVLYRDLCILNFGPGEHSFLVAMNKKTGKTAWQVEIPETFPEKRTDGFTGKGKGVIGSWSTPIVIQANGRDELVMNFPEKVRSFDPATGKEWWSCEGLNPLIYTSPVYGEGLIVAMGGFYGNHLAVRPGGSGNVTETHRVWEQVRAKSGIGSAVIYQGHIYNMMGSMALCWELSTGKPVWEERMQGSGADSDSWSSPVLVGDKIFQLNHSGDTVVFRASPKFEKIGINSLGGEMCNSSLAISAGDIFIRTHQHLWCIGRGK